MRSGVLGMIAILWGEEGAKVGVLFVVLVVCCEDPFVVKWCAPRAESNRCSFCWWVVGGCLLCVKRCLPHFSLA